MNLGAHFLISHLPLLLCRNLDSGTLLSLFIRRGYGRARRRQPPETGSGRGHHEPQSPFSDIFFHAPSLQKRALFPRLLNFFPALYLPFAEKRALFPELLLLNILQGTRAGWTTSPPPRTGAAARPSSSSRRGRTSPTPARTFSHRSTGRSWTGTTSTSAAAALCWWTCPGRPPRSWCLPWGRTGWCTLGTGTTWEEWGVQFSRRR